MLHSQQTMTSAFVQESDDSLKSDLEGVNVNHCERPSDVVPQELANQKRESSRLDPRPGTRRYRIQLPRVNLTLSQAPAPVSPDSTISHRVLSRPPACAIGPSGSLRFRL